MTNSQSFAVYKPQNQVFTLLELEHLSKQAVAEGRRIARAVQYSDAFLRGMSLNHSLGAGAEFAFVAVAFLAAAGLHSQGDKDGKSEALSRAKNALVDVNVVGLAKNRAIQEVFKVRLQSVRAAQLNHEISDLELPALDIPNRFLAASNSTQYRKLKSEVDKFTNKCKQAGAGLFNVSNISSVNKLTGSSPFDSVFNAWLQGTDNISLLNQYYLLLPEDIEGVFKEPFEKGFTQEMAAYHATQDEYLSAVNDGRAYAAACSALKVYKSSWERAFDDASDGFKATFKKLAKQSYEATYRKTWDSEMGRYEKSAVVVASLGLELNQNALDSGVVLFSLVGTLQNLGGLTGRASIHLDPGAEFWQKKQIEMIDLEPMASTPINLEEALSVLSGRALLLPKAPASLKISAKINTSSINIPITFTFSQLLDAYTKVKPDSAGQNLLAQAILINLKEEWDHNHGFWYDNIYSPFKKTVPCYLKALVEFANGGQDFSELRERVLEIYQDTGFFPYWRRHALDAKDLAAKL